MIVLSGVASGFAALPAIFAETDWGRVKGMICCAGVVLSG